MPSGVRRLIAAAGIGSGLAAAVLTAPVADAQPSNTTPSNCLPGVRGQVVYCDQDINPDGSWVRCSQQNSPQITVFGGVGSPQPQGPADCRLVRPNSLPVGSPPYHIGYGGEATGRV